MGRPRLPMACSKCGRLPTQVRIYRNRYCVDCMRVYNKNYRTTRAFEDPQGNSNILVINEEEEELVGSDEVESNLNEAFFKRG